MEEIIRITLPLYFLLYFIVAFVLKSLYVAKRIGKNPLVLPKDDSPHGLVGLYFKLCLISILVYVIGYAFYPIFFQNLSAFSIVDQPVIKYIGFALLLISFTWTIVAQSNMKNSWRIGIDHENNTDLITKGLFRFSRNPIFLGMIISLVALLLVTPNVFTVFFLVFGYVLIQIQISLEEEFLFKKHGQLYLDFKQKVPRLISFMPVRKTKKENR